MSKAVVKSEHGVSLLQRVGNRYGLDPGKVYETLCKTAFRDAQTQEQVIALLVVADQYKLNPFTREIYAFPDKKSGGIVPVVGIDGWLRIINDHPQFDGMEFAESDERATVGHSQEAPDWMECIIYRKDRSHPVITREYLHEVYRDTPAWNQTTARMLRHRSIMQCARIAFGFGGIVDPDDAERAAVAFDVDGVVLSESHEPVRPVVGPGDYKKLIRAALRYGYTEDDVAASAATLGYEGPGESMPEDVAQKLYAGMKDNPKVAEEASSDGGQGFRTPLMGEDHAD